MKLPLAATVEYARREDDTFIYDFAVTIPGNAASLTVVQIASDLDNNAAITRVRMNGLGLEDGIRDRFLTRLFQCCHYEMLLQHGRDIERTFSDMTRFIDEQFGCADASSIKFALGTLAEPSTRVVARTVVRSE